MATNLEMQAINLVNEEIMGPEVTDEQKYNNLLETRKDRKAVSIFHCNQLICSNSGRISI